MQRRWTSSDAGGGFEIRLDEDGDYQPLSERLKQIVSHKRAGTLAGIALVAELSKLAEEVVRSTEESKLPLRDQFAKAAWERRPDSKAGQADDVADAILAKADEFCFPNWFQKDDVDTTLYRDSRSCWPGNSQTSNFTGRARISLTVASSC